MVLWRLSICQDWAAPFEMVSTTALTSSPAFLAKWIPSARPSTRPAMQFWLTIFVSWPEPLAHPGVGRDDRLGAGIGVLGAAAHHGQDAVFRTRRTAGHRTVDE